MSKNGVQMESGAGFKIFNSGSGSGRSSIIEIISMMSDSGTLIGQPCSFLSNAGGVRAPPPDLISTFKKSLDKPVCFLFFDMVWEVDPIVETIFLKLRCKVFAFGLVLAKPSGVLQ